MKVVFKFGTTKIATGLATWHYWFFKTTKTILFDEQDVYEYLSMGNTRKIRSYKSLRLLRKIDQLKRECYCED